MVPPPMPYKCCPAGRRSYLSLVPSWHCSVHYSQDPQGKALSRASPGSCCHLLPARLSEDDYGPTAALEGGLHGTHGGSFCGVAGNGRQAAEFLK